jgi:hypothetical protein
MKKCLMIALVSLLVQSSFLVGFAAEDAVKCVCPCHSEHETKAGNAKAQDTEESINMLNRAEQKPLEEKSEYLREQIYNW